MTERIKALPQRGQAAQAPQEMVAARTGNYLSALPQASGELDGLIKGLSSLNPALNGYMKNAFEKETKADAAAGQAYGQNVQNPTGVLRGEVPVSPVAAPPAVSDTFRENMREVLSQRTGIENKVALFNQYNEQKHNPEFSPEAWLVEQRVSALKGITDPASQALVGAHLNEVEASIKADVGRTRMARAEEVRKTTLDAVAGDTFTSNLDGEQMYSRWADFLTTAKKSGFSAPEAAQVALQRVAHASNLAGGMPEMFEMFTKKGPDGVPIGGGEMLAQVEALRTQAKAKREKAIHEDTELGRAGLYKGYEDDLNGDISKVTWERLMNDIGPHGLSAKEAAAYWSQRNDALAKLAGAHAVDGLANLGELWKEKESVQKNYLEANGKELVNMLGAAKDPADFAKIGASMLMLHTKTGASVPLDVMKRRIETLITNLPNASGASTAFAGAAELYKALSANPAYRDLYFDEKSSRVMEAYKDGTERGEDAQTAYSSAYRHTTPEYQKAATEFKASPAYQELLKKDLSKYVTGTTPWRPKWTGGNGRTPDNGEVVNVWARDSVVRFRADNPWATPDDVERHMEREIARNWVLDKTSGMAVQVAPGDGVAAKQEAISAYTKELTEKLKLGDMPDGDWKIAMLRNGDQDAYGVYIASGTGKRLIANVHMSQLLDKQSIANNLSPAEKAEIGRVQKLIRSGGDLSDANLEVLTKARGLGLLKGTDLESVKGLEGKVLTDRIASVPKFLTDKPDFTDLKMNPNRKGVVDYGATSRIAAEFHQYGTFKTTAASLVTMGEGVALQVYEDPARGAGLNIGMGYNLNANAATLHTDFRRAGIPEERIKDVTEGRASITEAQAKRLLSVSLERYEKIAETTAKATDPDLWNRMTTAQKAVMTDIAYQVGSVDKFKKAWGAIAKGDMETFKREAAVTYVNRSGERVADTRRNNIRAALLSGTPLWNSVINQTGKLPSNKLEAFALK